MQTSNSKDASPVIVDDGTREVASATKIQAFARSRIALKHVVNLQKNKKIEALRRLKAAREKRKKVNSAISIQAMVRGAIQRPKYKSAKTHEKLVECRSKSSS